MIDWNRVAELREEVGADDFDEVVELFLDEVDASVAALAPGCDPKRLETELHFIKGSALNLGFGQLSQLCQAGEKAAAGGETASIDIAGVAGCYAASRVAFLAGLQERALGSG